MTQNLIKTILFLILVSCLFPVIGYIFYERQGLLLGFAIAVVWNFVVYFYSDSKQRFFSIHELEGADPWNIRQTVALLANEAKIPTPTVFMYASSNPTVFSIGQSWSSASIVLSKNLTQVLTSNEIKAVLAHEVFHIKQLDILAYGVGSVVMGFWLFVGNLLDRCFFFKKDRQTGFFTSLFTPIALFCLLRLINPQSDYLADQFASQVCQNPEDMAKALWKLASYQQTQGFKVSLAMAHFFIVNPYADHSFSSLPSVKNRILQLIGRYPI